MDKKTMVFDTVLHTGWLQIYSKDLDSGFQMTIPLKEIEFSEQFLAWLDKEREIMEE